MADKADKAAKRTKGKDAKGGKPADGGSADGPSVAGHPRAARQVALAKGWGGLIGFVLGGYLSLPTNTLVEAGVRALVAGSVCYVVAWGVAVFAWRQLVVIEIKRRQQDLLANATSMQLDAGVIPAQRHSAESPGARAAS